MKKKVTLLLVVVLLWSLGFINTETYANEKDEPNKSDYHLNIDINKIESAKDQLISNTAIEITTNSTSSVVSKSGYSMDFPSEWANKEVLEAIECGILPSEFQKNYATPITRGDFCELIINTLRIQNPDILNSANAAEIEFVDTNNLDIKLASSLDIVAGIGNNKFNPNGEITRQEAARMLYKAATIPERIKKTEKYFNYSFIDSNKRIDFPNHFNDISKFDYWASLGIQYCYQNGIMYGVGQNNFDPYSNYTREQAYLTSLRLFKKFNGEKTVSIDAYNEVSSQNFSEKFDKVYAMYDNKTVVKKNNIYSLIDPKGNYIIDDISRAIASINEECSYVYDCYGDWIIVMEPLYTRTDNSIYKYQASLYTADGRCLWTMPDNLHFTDSGDVLYVNEFDDSDGDNIIKARYILFERNKYNQSDYSVVTALIYRK